VFLIYGRVEGAWQNLIKLLAILGAEDDGAAHFAADAVLARGSQDHGLGDGENAARKIAGSPVGGKLLH
jgi:hypothetical protein